MRQPGVSSATTGSFRLILPTVVKECTFYCQNLVSIRVVYFQFVFPKGLTFISHILMQV